MNKELTQQGMPASGMTVMNFLKVSICISAYFQLPQAHCPQLKREVKEAVCKSEWLCVYLYGLTYINEILAFVNGLISEVAVGLLTAINDLL